MNDREVLRVAVWYFVGFSLLNLSDALLTVTIIRVDPHVVDLSPLVNVLKWFILHRVCVALALLCAIPMLVYALLLYASVRCMRVNKKYVRVIGLYCPCVPCIMKVVAIIHNLQCLSCLVPS